MTIQSWLERVEEDREALRSLIVNWHPKSTKYEADRPGFPITAERAETLGKAVRQLIQEEKGNEKPAELFDNALRLGGAQAVGIIYSLLNAAWFGVPESNACWLIPGFSEAVDLMDDMPEPEPEFVPQKSTRGKLKL